MRTARVFQSAHRAIWARQTGP